MIFPKEFFQEETRWDFTISEMMKRAWAAELEVLNVISEVCDKNNLTYYADGGTLLGTVRHKGFIPWDDDIDICMLRKDYNRFIEVAPKALPDGFVLAGMYAKEKRLQDAAPVSHMRVIADEEYFSFPTYLTRFHGFPYPRIGIDIFPYDYVSKDKIALSIQLKRFYMITFTLQNWELYKKEGLLEAQLDEIDKACEMKLKRDDELKHNLWLLSDSIASATPLNNADGVTNIQYIGDPGVDPLTYLKGNPVEWYGKGTTLPFEHLTINAPLNYVEAVRNMYGEDYMTPVKFSSGHDYPFYKKQEAELKRMFDREGIDTPIDVFCRNWHNMTGGN